MLVDTPQVTVCQATLLGSEHISPRRRDPRTPSQAATVGGRMGEKTTEESCPRSGKKRSTIYWKHKTKQAILKILKLIFFMTSRISSELQVQLIKAINIK